MHNILKISSNSIMAGLLITSRKKYEKAKTGYAKLQMQSNKIDRYTF